MKKYGIIAIGILALAAIIICTIFIGRLTPQTVEGVKSALIEKGYYSDKHYKDLTLNGISTMANFGNGLNITLYDYGKKKDACDEMFDLMIETYKNDTRLTRKKHKNYTICEYSNETNYWIISRVDNTILLVIGAKEDADQTKEFAKGIGYYKWSFLPNTNIEWSIDFDEVYEKLDNMTHEEIASALEISADKCANMTTSEIHDYAYDLFRHSPAILYEFLDLPVEVELPEELGNTANDYYNEDITEWLSDTYGYCVETFTYVKGDLLRKLKRCMAVRSSLFSSF